MTGSPIRVVELRSPVDGGKLPRATARLGWRSPLNAGELATIARWADARGGASIRLHGTAVEQLDDVLTIVRPVNLEVEATRIARPPRHGGTVAGLSFAGLPSRFRETIASFGGVRTLRIDARGGAVDAGALAVLPLLRGFSIAQASLRGCTAINDLRSLAALELVRTRVDHLDAPLRHPGLAALRLANVQPVTTLEALSGHPNLRSLALESLLHLESLAPVATLPVLERLTIGGLWQFNVADAAFIAGIRTLRELSLDIGGTRKNVEITKLLGLPEPSPLDVGAYDLSGFATEHRAPVAGPGETGSFTSKTNIDIVSIDAG